MEIWLNGDTHQHKEFLRIMESILLGKATPVSAGTSSNGLFNGVSIWHGMVRYDGMALLENTGSDGYLYLDE